MTQQGPDRNPAHRPQYRYFQRHRQREPVFASIVRRFADAVARLRGVHREPIWTDDTVLWDDQADDDGWAVAGIPRLPPDKSGSGSVALSEPDDSDDA
jgi:hypothetical protein